MAEKFEDFGKHIGGARKELYAQGVRVEDLSELSDVERNKLLTKNAVWGKIDYQALFDEGRERAAVYFIKTIKDSLPAKPTGASLEDGERYVEFINLVKEDAMTIQNVRDVQNFFDRVMPKFCFTGGRIYSAKPQYERLVSRKFFNAAQVRLPRLVAEMEKAQFLYTDEERLRANVEKEYVAVQYPLDAKWETTHDGRPFFGVRGGLGTYFFYPKGEFANEADWKPGTFFLAHKHNIIAYNLPNADIAMAMAYAEYQAQHPETTKEPRLRDTIPYLTKLERTGPRNTLSYATPKPQDLLDTFAFHGGEFGNYETIKDREKNISLSYDALCDMARALNISVKDISLDGTLSIAYGARGRGGQNGGLAHYEPIYHVINLTKIKGAGSLAHEWGHALDHYLFQCQFPGRENQMTSAQLAQSENFSSLHADTPVAAAVDAMRFKQDPETGATRKTDYYMDAIKLDMGFHASRPYYTRNEEMLARAFACYVSDKLSAAGMKNDYLCGHADVQSYTAGQLGVKGDPERVFYASPQGEERKTINGAFDTLFDDLRARGIFHEFDEKEISLLPKPEPKRTERIDSWPDLSSVRQMSIFDFMDKDNNDQGARGRSWDDDGIDR